MNYTFRKATAILFSRIVLTQLDNEQRSAFRKAEKLTKQYTKIKSDLKYGTCKNTNSAQLPQAYFLSEWVDFSLLQIDWYFMTSLFKFYHEKKV